MVIDVKTVEIDDKADAVKILDLEKVKMEIQMMIDMRGTLVVMLPIVSQLYQCFDLPSSC